ncbi:mucoidy inhibitor MuiA family protein [Nocardia otitidiscaviarum]|uniref:mucoidy inhibitor MuiA family protein n=1 Tax=Nocardia otitidiscaviarum TaxID=1823 RepID=UPI0004A72138|nr:mucoidy inhibitor MuiA family protein [Nocardia otitidiscaviarum]MBF6136200.1 mucoidy inhibitor MuiA family protein [Nocardia otitidiscaviarum]MBF6483982.1 mucoidy inhibitor MuiA family protein [Nocardia otitidiscaviarum]
MPTVTAPIVAVTVYPQQARVTRRAEFDVAEGPRIVFAGLPTVLDADSVRVAGAGPARIVGVDVRTAHHPDPADAKRRELTAQRKALQATIDGITDEAQAAATKVEMLTGLARGSAESFAQALAKGKAEPGRIATVGGALDAQLAQALKARRAITVRLDEAQEELDALDRRIQSMGRQSGRDSTEVVVELEPTGEGLAELELSYLVTHASWEPTYDIRVSDKEVAVSWFGLVTQYTGEDWPECELSLSTARPTVTVAVPELRPWYLDRARPLPRPSQPRRSGPSDAAPLGAVPPAAMAASESHLDADEEVDVASFMRRATADMDQGVTASTYRTQRPVAIPLGARGHRVSLAELEFPANLGYITAPVQAEEAYLRAEVTNNSEHTLRAGKASIFRGEEFVGSTRIGTWAPGEELELALGVDDRIRIERKLVRRTASKATLSSTSRREAEYRTSIANHTPAAIAVTVLDQSPVSRDEAITVKDVRTSPTPAETTDLGEITWKLEIAPGKTETVNLSFRVDVAKGVEITGWR